MNVIDSNTLEHDVFRKPLRTFRHHAPDRTLYPRDVTARIAAAQAECREASRITADDILKAAGNIESADDSKLPGSILVNEVVVPAVAEAERAFSVALAGINLGDMIRRAEPHKSQSAGG
jgi:hypothetical protein